MPRIEKRDENKVGIKHMDRDVLSRLLGLIFRDNRLGFTVVIVCILVSVFTNVANSMFLSNLIDDYLTPMLASGSTDFSGLARAVTGMACIYVAGVIAIFVREQLMARITQGTMKDIRDQMFSHMQSLPIRYFDTHIHGTIMSYYSNDTDTLRQMISQSIPNMIMSLVMIVAGVHLDAHHQPGAHRLRAGYPGHHHAHCAVYRQPFRPLLHPPAERPRRHQRLHRRDGRRPARCPGVLPRGGGQEGL